VGLLAEGNVAKLMQRSKVLVTPVFLQEAR